VKFTSFAIYKLYVFAHVILFRFTLNDLLLVSVIFIIGASGFVKKLHCVLEYHVPKLFVANALKNMCVPDGKSDTFIVKFHVLDQLPYSDTFVHAQSVNQFILLRYIPRSVMLLNHV
jgi:hypothetical protein